MFLLVSWRFQGVASRPPNFKQVRTFLKISNNFLSLKKKKLPIEFTSGIKKVIIGLKVSLLGYRLHQFFLDDCQWSHLLSTFVPQLEIYIVCVGFIVSLILLPGIPGHSHLNIIYSIHLSRKSPPPPPQDVRYNLIGCKILLKQ